MCTFWTGVYGLGDWGSVSVTGSDGIFFLFATASRPALGLVQPPAQWVRGWGVAGLSSGGKAAGV